MTQWQADELYREVILEHYRNSPWRKDVVAPTGTAEGMNPLCGDEVHFTVRVEDGRITDIGFGGQGCAISQASASLFSEALANTDPAHLQELTRHFEAMLLEGADPDPELGDLAALQGVAKLAARVKCAMLAPRTLGEALS